MEDLVLWLIVLVILYFGIVFYLIMKKQNEISMEIKQLWEALDDQKAQVNKIDTATFLLSTGEDGDLTLIADR